MRHHVGDELRTSIGAERALEVASLKMMALGDGIPFEAEKAELEASEKHWKEDK